MHAQIVHHHAYTTPLPPGHRFPMPKFGLLMEHLRAAGLAEAGQVHFPEPAPRAWLELAHDPGYVAAVLEQTLSPEAERRLGLPMSPQLALRSRVAAGGTLLAARLALRFGLACNTAGGGHHASAGAGSGFCVFNDVAVAARVLITEGSVRRVVVVDLDVHQGDGTAAIFRDDPRVFTLSVHCGANFPARKEPGDVDVALAAGTGDADYLAALRPVLDDALDRIGPDLVFYNAGVDPHEADRLGRLALTDAGLAEREAMVLQACQRRGVPLACVTGGGYAPTLDELVARHAILHRVIRDLGNW